MGRPKILGICAAEGCDKDIYCKGFCRYHYNKARLEADPSKAYSGLRGHPLYNVWFERKTRNSLCERWMDFKTFAEDVGIRPEGNFYLAKLTKELYGPDNFKWVEHLKRNKGESSKDWYARKWAARQNAYPGMERARNYRRFFNMTVDQYEEMLLKQNGCCAICNNPETSLDHKTGSIKRLAVDHCHKTNKIRELLCWRCNAAIGRVEENIELLEKMKQYLIKHKEDC